MTDQELLGVARQALNIAKTEYELAGWPAGIVLISWHAGEGVHRMRRIERMLQEKLGERWLSSGPRKAAGFQAIRFAVQLTAPDALAIVTATNMFKPTQKLRAMPPGEQRRLLVASGHDAHRRMAAQGLLTIVDSMTAAAQTAERVCISIQEIDHGEFAGQPETQFFAQNEFEGRLKMYGEMDADDRKEFAEYVASMAKKVQ